MIPNNTFSFTESTLQIRLFLMGDTQDILSFRQSLSDSFSELHVFERPIRIEDVQILIVYRSQKKRLGEWIDVEEKFSTQLHHLLPLFPKVFLLGVSSVYQVVCEQVDLEAGMHIAEQFSEIGIDVELNPYKQEIPGGYLYLLKSPSMPTLGYPGFISAIRYLAFSDIQKEGFLNAYISGPAMSIRDISIHKGHNNVHSFRWKTAKNKLQDILDNIDQDVQSLFRKQDILGEDTKAALEKLSESLRHLVRIYIDLTGLATSNAQQYVNYRHSFDGEEATLAQGQVWRFLRERMRILREEIDIKITECKAVLEATQQAISMIQTRIDQADEALERKQEKRRQRTEELLAYLGLGIALPELISYDLVKTLWEYWFNKLAPIYYFLIQLLLIAFFGLVLVKIIRNATDNFGKKANGEELNKPSG